MKKEFKILFYYMGKDHAIHTTVQFEKARRFLKENPWHIEDQISKRIRVSTVFLPINLGWRTTPPLPFETVIFGGKRNGEIRRYATLKEAQKGHAETVTSLK